MRTSLEGAVRTIIAGLLTWPFLFFLSYGDASSGRFCFSQCRNAARVCQPRPPARARPAGLPVKKRPTSQRTDEEYLTAVVTVAAAAAFVLITVAYVARKNAALPLMWLSVARPSFLRSQPATTDRRTVGRTDLLVLRQIFFVRATKDGVGQDLATTATPPLLMSKKLERKKERESPRDSIMWNAERTNERSDGRGRSIPVVCTCVCPDLPHSLADSAFPCCGFFLHCHVLFFSCRNEIFCICVSTRTSSLACGVQGKSDSALLPPCSQYSPCTLLARSLA